MEEKTFDESLFGNFGNIDDDFFYDVYGNRRDLSTEKIVKNKEDKKTIMAEKKDKTNDTTIPYDIGDAPAKKPIINHGKEIKDPAKWTWSRNTMNRYGYIEAGRATLFANELKNGCHRAGTAKEGIDLTDREKGLRSGYLMAMTDNSGEYKYKQAREAGFSPYDEKAYSWTKKMKLDDFAKERGCKDAKEFAEMSQREQHEYNHKGDNE